MTATPYKPAGNWGAKRPLAGKCRAALHKLQILLLLLMAGEGLAEGTPSCWLVRPLEDRVYFGTIHVAQVSWFQRALS